MNCPECGAPVGKNDEYCGSCGCHIISDGGKPSDRKGKNKKKSPVILIITIILEIIAIAAVAAALLFGLPDKVSSSSESDEKKIVEPTKTPIPTETSMPTETPVPTDTPVPTPLPEPVLMTEVNAAESIRSEFLRVSKNEVATAEASTTIKQNKVANYPIYVFDDDITTNWQEGVDGSGIGQYIDFTLTQSYAVEAMTFKLGNWKEQKYFYGNNRPKTLQIDTDHDSWTVTFPDSWTEFAVKFTSPVEISKIKITIMDVYKGTSWDDTPITDIGIWHK